jgi:5-methylcytosine-specific restriction endonuclease McrA
MREAKEVHHIKHLDDYPELAFDDNNLISLCSACHRKMHPEKGIQGPRKYTTTGNAYGSRGKRAKN